MNPDAYPLKPFRIHSGALLRAVMRAYPLATLMTGAAGAARLTLVPLLVEDTGGDFVLTGHIDRNNAQAAAIETGTPVSFQFLGPDSYASPDLYPDPQLPGWLYVSVQGDGEIAEVLDGPTLRAVLIEATEIFGGTGQRFALAPDDPRIDKFLPGIVGFRVAVTRISGIAKLAQDKGQTDSEIAMRFLADQNNEASLDLFETLLTAYFSPRP